MDKPIQSMPTFVIGVILVALGLAVVVAELTPLGMAETASVSGLAAGAVILVAAVMAPRGRARSDQSLSAE